MSRLTIKASHIDLLDTVLRTKVLAINVKVRISKPSDAVKTNWNNHIDLKVSNGQSSVFHIF